MLCLRCGYVNEDRKPGSDYTKRDKAHHRRCDYTMCIRYRNNTTGRITGGARPRGRIRRGKIRDDRMPDGALVIRLFDGWSYIVKRSSRRVP